CVRAESWTSKAAIVGNHGSFGVVVTHDCSSATSVGSPTRGPFAACKSELVVVAVSDADDFLGECDRSQPESTRASEAIVATSSGALMWDSVSRGPSWPGRP